MRFGTFDRNEVRDNKVGYKIDSSFAIGIHLIKMKLHNALVIVQVSSKYWWHWWHNIMVIKSRQAIVPQRVRLWHRQQHLVVWSISIDKIAPRELQWQKLPETFERWASRCIVTCLDQIIVQCYLASLHESYHITESVIIFFSNFG